MQKAFRLRREKSFRRLREEGRSWSHPLLVLVAAPNDLPHSRVGFVVSKRVGNKAVVRNRVKRRLREAVRLRWADIPPGWDLLFITRPPIREADFHQIERAVEHLLRRARLLKENSRL